MHSSTLTKIKTLATAAATALLAALAFGADYSFGLLPGQAPFSIATGINNHGIVVGLCREGVCGIGPALEGSVGFVDDGTFRPVSGKVPTTLAGSRSTVASYPSTGSTITGWLPARFLQVRPTTPMA